MPVLKIAKAQRWLQSEILLVVLGLGLVFLLHPELFSDPAYAPLAVLPSTVWAGIFLASATVGFIALYKAKPQLWKGFCVAAVFLLITMAVTRFQTRQVTATVTYSVLAWSATLRAAGIPSATFISSKRKQL